MRATLATLVVLAALALLALGVPVPARAGTPAQDLAWLNEKRAANGIPAGIVEVPAWSASCRQHLAYLRETGTMSHAEDPASPHYTSAGNWAGTHAVLASALTWTRENFIWEYAPLHLAQLLAPQLSRVGIADDGQFVCVTTWPGYVRTPPARDAILTYPGNGTGTYETEFSQEWPITPAQALGLANPTGPHLFVYVWGPSTATGFGANGLPLAITGATLRGPRGAVPVRWVDATSGVVGRYLPLATGIVIPTRTLIEYARYEATVRLSDGSEHAWAFTTSDGGEQLALRRIRFSAQRSAHVRACVRRRAGRCVAVRWRHLTTLRVRGRYTDADFDAGGRAAAVEAQLDGAARGLMPASRADGSFSGRFALVFRGDRLKLLLRLRAGDDFAAYIVRIRVRRRHGHLVVTATDPRRVPVPLPAPPLRRVGPGRR